MKKLSTLAALCLCAGLWGCASTGNETAMMTSPGAVSECGASCESACSDKDAAYGAMSENKCSSKSECSGEVCPVTGKPVADMGVMGDKPSSCSGTKSDCSSKPVADMGAMSESPASCATKSSCSSMKKSCGNK